MPYKDIQKRRECARKSARKSRLLYPERQKIKSRLDRLRNPESWKIRKKRNYTKYRDKYLNYNRKRNAEHRLQVLTHYSKGKLICSCCGEKEYRFLTLEHLNGGGTKERKRIGPSNLCLFLIKNCLPSGYDVLCYNCNCGKSKTGVCPHKLLGIK